MISVILRWFRGDFRFLKGAFSLLLVYNLTDIHLQIIYNIQAEEHFQVFSLFQTHSHPKLLLQRGRRELCQRCLQGASVGLLWLLAALMPLQMHQMAM